MDERIIVKGKQANEFKIISLALLVLGFILGFSNSVNYSLFRGFNNYFWKSIFPYCMSIWFLPLAIIAILLYFSVAKTEITVTDKRVYGKAMFGKRVDLPVDLISAVGTNFLKGVSVSTSSGKISFLGIKNKDKIHEEISKLLMVRQEKTPIITTKQEVPQSNADELKKFKDLLDSGILTQEEFDAKKKQLLGL